MADANPPPRLNDVFDLDAEINEEGVLVEGLPHSRELGMRMHFTGAGKAVLSVPWDARLIGDPATGVLHGGVITALLDTACGAAVMCVPEKLRSIATLDLRIDYMRPATKGQTVLCEATCYRTTRSIGFTRAVAFHDDPSDPVATASGAFILDRLEEKQA